MIRKLNWRAYTSKDRLEVLEEVKRLVMTSSGYIVNFQAFSDLALSLSIQIEEKGIPDLWQALSSVLEVSDTELNHLNPNSESEWLIFIHISFTRGKGNLETIVPEVPG